MKSWTVYEHISPSDKVYVGITCQDPKKRWKGGSGYVRTDNHQPLFANAILKYGWDNIEHKIIFTNLSHEEACSLEKLLITKYKRLHKSYNITDGGDGGLGTKHTEETKKHLSEVKKGKKGPEGVGKKIIKGRVENYPYIVIAINPETVLSFHTAKEAAISLGIKHEANISAAVAGKQCLVKGYVFVYWDKSLPIDEKYLHDLYNTKVNNRYKSKKKEL